MVLSSSHPVLQSQGLRHDLRQVVEKRMRRAAEEAESIDQYEFIVSNEEGKLEDCMNTIHSIIESESCRITKRQEFVESLREGLQQYKENTEKDK